MPHRIVIGLFIPLVVYVVFLIADWIDIIRTHGSNAVGAAICCRVKTLTTLSETAESL